MNIPTAIERTRNLPVHLRLIKIMKHLFHFKIVGYCVCLFTCPLRTQNIYISEALLICIKVCILCAYLLVLDYFLSNWFEDVIAIGRYNVATKLIKYILY